MTGPSVAFVSWGFPTADLALGLIFWRKNSAMPRWQYSLFFSSSSSTSKRLELPGVPGVVPGLVSSTMKTRLLALSCLQDLILHCVQWLGLRRKNRRFASSSKDLPRSPVRSSKSRRRWTFMRPSGSFDHPSTMPIASPSCLSAFASTRAARIDCSFASFRVFAASSCRRLDSIVWFFLSASASLLAAFKSASRVLILVSDALSWSVRLVLAVRRSSISLSLSAASLPHLSRSSEISFLIAWMWFLKTTHAFSMAVFSIFCTFAACSSSWRSIWSCAWVASALHSSFSLVRSLSAFSFFEWTFLRLILTDRSSCSLDRRSSSSCTSSCRSLLTSASSLSAMLRASSSSSRRPWRYLFCARRSSTSALRISSFCKTFDMNSMPKLAVSVLVPKKPRSPSPVSGVLSRRLANPVRGVFKLRRWRFRTGPVLGSRSNWRSRRVTSP
mmetsp:Transcript_14417/g.41172  ORF Transcript_14417/g.41172 Transcript_14417/m.41172 type:complete len:443 (-) Transcript_14417:1234-2562(-)